ncbi:hypothetical protein, partial [Massilia antarctica]|uniref:hypothetical protein n=1 Tax=Massilia antarctica TaxID=2765360 RepID=UPI0035EEEBA7
DGRRPPIIFSIHHRGGCGGATAAIARPELDHTCMHCAPVQLVASGQVHWFPSNLLLAGHCRLLR